MNNQIIRHMYRAQCKENSLNQVKLSLNHYKSDIKSLVDNNNILTLSAFHRENQIFLYFETNNYNFNPEHYFLTMGEYLLDWPGETVLRKWVPMIDVFHFNAPASFDHWKRNIPVDRRIGKIAYLRPEMVASYIYYHYQLQEERAFLGEKYKFISLHENLLFMYFETPEVTEEPVLPPKLNTKGTPENWSDSHMELHFKPWEEDGYLYFKEMESILDIE